MTLLNMSKVEASTPAHRSDQVFTLAQQYQQIRQFTEELCEPLVTEDYIIQAMPDVSPTKWHIAHVSWFFETFLLRDYDPSYKLLNETYPYLFNSYYVSAGNRWTRANRGLLSRPTVADVYQYRRYVDEHMLNFLEKIDEDTAQEITPLMDIGFNHEQQHQELMLTDIKYNFSINPLYPVYRPYKTVKHGRIPTLGWVAYEAGVYHIGHHGDGFIFDNEAPRHRVFAERFQLSNRLITNGEFMEFIQDGGYEKTLLWLSMGWDAVQTNGWQAPLYWEKVDGTWYHYTLAGLRELDLDEPVTHVSYYEADAFARWAGARLPTEAEWEIAAQPLPIQGNFVDDRHYHPIPLNEPPTAFPAQMYGDVWEWTASHYSPYPGYEPAPGSIGEYNGKFMANQFVLRGGSCATMANHIRPTYRNFFPGHARWQFMGFRLAKAA